MTRQIKLQKFPLFLVLGCSLLFLLFPKSHVEQNLEDNNFLEYLHDQGGISYIFGLENPQEDLKVQNEVLNVPYSVESVVGDLDFKFLAFIDGIPQKFVNESHIESSYVYEINVKEGTTNRFVLPISTQNLLSGKDHTLRILHLLNTENATSNFSCLMDSDSPYGFVYPVTNQANPPYKKLTENHEFEKEVFLSEFSDPLTLISQEQHGNKWQGILHCSSQSNTTYRITFFVNNTPVKVAGNDYWEVSLQANESLSSPLLIEHEFQKGDTLYAIMIPDNDASDSIVPYNSNFLTF